MEGRTHIDTCRANTCRPDSRWRKAREGVWTTAYLVRTDFRAHVHRHMAWLRRLSVVHSVFVTEFWNFGYSDASWSLGLGMSCSDFKRRQPLSVCSRDDNLSRHTGKISLCTVVFCVFCIPGTLCAERRDNRAGCTLGLVLTCGGDRFEVGTGPDRVLLRYKRGLYRCDTRDTMSMLAGQGSNLRLMD